MLFMDNNIGKRLKAFRDRTGRKMGAISIATGIKTDTLYKWEKGTRPSNVAEYTALTNYLNKMESVPESWPINDKQTNLTEGTFTPAVMRLNLASNKHAVPANSSIAAPGSVMVINNEPQMVVDFIKVPCLGDVEGLVNVEGDSMAPTFENGSKAVIQRLNDPTLLNWGDCYYIIDKNLNGLLRRLTPGKNDESLILKADNPDQEKFPPITRSLSQIQAIFRAKAQLVRR
jgi:phage repressor protein C with HTH and peptisase S24 domain